MEATYFLGASTPRGFFSYFDGLFREVRRVTVLKGGPGCGKSTFLRAICRAAAQRGMEVEQILCSSDPESLDGVILPRLSCAFVDGTAPHVLEPRLCGGNMNYLNFGEFYDRVGMAGNEAEILRVQEENAAQYPRVTALLAAADRVLETVRLETAAAPYETELSALAACLCLSALQPTEGKGQTRQRFLSAVTPRGLWLCGKTPEVLGGRIFVLKDNYGLAPRLLAQVEEKARAMGHTCVACYSPMRPEGAPIHLLLPTARVSFVSDSRNFPYTGPSFCRLDLDAILPAPVRQSLEYSLRTVNSLLYQSVSYLRQAHRLHDRMEQLCRPFVDFAAVDAMTAATLREIFG